MKLIGKSGFSLVEVALALLVAGVGLLAVFSLFPSGVKMSKASSDETLAALFAEQVLNGVRAQVATARWDQVRTSINLPPPTEDVWANPSQLRVTLHEEFQTLVFRTAGALAGSSVDYPDFGVRYKLEVNRIPNSYRYALRLLVRPGEFGTTNTYVFYSEIYNHGQN